MAQEVERARIEGSADLEELERTLDRVHALRRRTRCSARAAAGSAILHPEIYEMQMHAIVRAAPGGAARRTATRRSSR